MKAIPQMRQTRRLSLLLMLSCATLAAIKTQAWGTVNTLASSTTISGTGALTVFPFSFIGVQPGDISAVYTDASGNQTTLTQGTGPTQFQVTLNAPVPGAIWGLGGSVTYNPSGTPIALGTTLTILRKLPLLQPYSLSNQGNLAQLAKSSEQAVDQLTMAVQGFSSAASYAIVANSANSVAPAQLPPAAQAAGLGLCFDGTGNNVIACSGTPAGTISSAMAPVVGAATIAAGQSAFGLGALSTYGIGAGLQSDGAGNARVNFTTTADATNTLVTPAFHQTSRIASGPLTYTVPASSSFWPGFGFGIYPLPGTGQVTIAINAADNFIGQAGGAAFIVYPGTSVFVTTNGAGNWFAQVSGTSSLPNHVPGEVIKMRTTGCPVGTVQENGASLSTTTYPELFAAIGYAYGGAGANFNVPQSGGQFDRNWISGQVADSGRTFGTNQLDQFQGHVFITNNIPTFGQSGTLIGSGSSTIGNTNIFTGTPVNGGYGAPRFGSETRPVNITVHSCIVTGQ